MKKLGYIGLMFFYLLSIAGMAWHTHFCGAELTFVKVYSGSFHEDDCECAETGSTDCCSDVLIKPQQALGLNPGKTLQAPERAQVKLFWVDAFESNSHMAACYLAAYYLPKQTGPPLLTQPSLQEIRILRI